MVQDIERLGVQVEDLGVGKSLAEPRSILLLLKFTQRLRKEGFSLLHCYLPRANFFGTVAGRLARVPIILVSKRSLEPARHLRWILTCRLTDAWADVALANSPAVWRHAVDVEGCRSEKLCLLPNGLDVERYRKPAANAINYRSAPVVGTVLRLEAIKGPESFLEAADRIAAELPAARFLIVGDGSMRSSLERHPVSLRLVDRLQFLGERSDVAEILPAFTVFLLPSLVEGMSMALLEAMAAARPVVATRVGGNVDLIQDGETGLLVPPGNPGEMARATLRLLHNLEWASQLGVAAQSVVMAHYSVERVVQQLENIYVDLLQRKRCGGELIAHGSQSAQG
jgi:glycosyltransferase involved in cell wall biosynthesis